MNHSEPIDPSEPIKFADFQKPKNNWLTLNKLTIIILILFAITGCYNANALNTNNLQEFPESPESPESQKSDTFVTSAVSAIFHPMVVKEQQQQLSKFKSIEQLKELEELEELEENKIELIKKITNDRISSIEILDNIHESNKKTIYYKYDEYQKAVENEFETQKKIIILSAELKELDEKKRVVESKISKEHNKRQEFSNHYQNVILTTTQEFLKNEEIYKSVFNIV